MPSKAPVAVAYQGRQPLASYQPFTTLWTIYLLSRYMLKLPFLYLYYLLPHNRGTPTRTLRQEILMAQMRAMFVWIQDIHYQMPRPLAAPKGLQDRWVILDPAPDSFYLDVAADEFVQPQPMPAMWYPRTPTASELQSDTQRIIMHFHGGAYCTGSCEPIFMGPTAAMVTEKLNAFIFMAGPRKASTPGNHFPAQIQDAITTYHYLLHTLHIPAAKIILSGNSSGAHLAFNLVRYALSHPALLPPPAAIITSSPWSDVRSTDFSSLVTRPSYRKDYLDFDFVGFCRNAFLPPGADVSGNPYLSILHHPFGLGGVPAWVVLGRDEVVFEEDFEFVKAMRRVEGNVVECYAAEGAPHDVLWSGPLVGFEKEAERAVGELGGFLEKYGL